MAIQILIADDHGVLRAGLRALLESEPDMQVVGEAADGREALRLVEELRPEILLLDVSMPGIDGIDTARQLKKSHPKTRVLILTMHEDVVLAREALQAGASGYLIKRAVESELISAIHAVARGDMYLHPAVARALLQDTWPAPPAPRPLTPRESEILRLVAQGQTNSQIAETMNLSLRTVEIHRMNLMRKLEAGSVSAPPNVAGVAPTCAAPGGEARAHPVENQT
jgi:DNA-binding NarL/FixJ family response regulator